MRNKTKTLTFRQFLNESETSDTNKLIDYIKANDVLGVKNLITKRSDNSGNYTNNMYMYNQTGLHLVASHGVGSRQVEIAKLFIDAGLDLNIKDDNGNTALMLATEYEKKELVKLLIDAGAIE